jgi:dolichol-phosphate mannosyltransferase
MNAANELHNVQLSIVAPAYNEVENMPRFVSECAAAGRSAGVSFEIVLANDRSTDGTSEKLSELMGEYPELRVLDMEKNSGQSAALDAAMRAARGRFIATLDADCQNDPADIPRLLAMIQRDECDCVNGWRKNRRDTGLRRLVSKYGNAFRNRVTRESIHDSGCGLKVFRRECIERMRLFNGGHRFFATLVRMDGWRVTEVVVNHRPRTAGVAKYGFFDRFFKVIRDAFGVRWLQDKTTVWRAIERRR